jgi:hypothetical protein
VLALCADNTILDLNITLLAFMIIISVLLIVILSLLLRCTLKRFRKTPASRDESEPGRTGVTNTGIVRARLDPEMPYAPLTRIAPPSYQETLLADQVVQTPDTEQRSEDNHLSSSTETLITPDSQEPPQYTEQ